MPTWPTPSRLFLSRCPPFGPPGLRFGSSSWRHSSHPRTSAEETKFNHAVQGLDNSTAEEISAFLTSPPAQGKYTALKDLFIDTFSLTQDEKDSRLFAIDGLGDRKPSALLRHMESFVKADERKSTVFRDIFLRNLPSSVRVALARNPPADLKDLAKAADAILAAEQAPPVVTSVEAVRTSKPARSGTATRCWYHIKYQADARRCSATTSGAPCDMAHTLKASGNASAGR